MNIFDAIILGIIQGVTEFLPVSSSGHLAVGKQLLSIPNVPILFDILLHIPTLIAVIIVFRRRLLSMVRSLFAGISSLFGKKILSDAEREDLRLSGILLLASVFTAVIGYTFNKFLPEPFPTRIIGIFFIVTAVILIAAHFCKGEREYSSLYWKDAILTGIGQGIGVLPGISRSGITISAARLAGLSRAQAGEYAFLIAIPAILGAPLLKMNEAATLNMSMPVLCAGLAASFVAGLGALLILLNLVKRGKLFYFSLYLIPLGILTIILGTL